MWECWHPLGGELKGNKLMVCVQARNEEGVSLHPTYVALEFVDL